MLQMAVVDLQLGEWIAAVYYYLLEGLENLTRTFRKCERGGEKKGGVESVQMGI